MKKFKPKARKKELKKKVKHRMSNGEQFWLILLFLQDLVEKYHIEILIDPVSGTGVL